MGLCLGKRKIPMSFLTQHFHLIHYKKRAILRAPVKAEHVQLLSSADWTVSQAKEEGPFSPNVHVHMQQKCNGTSVKPLQKQEGAESRSGIKYNLN